MMSYRDMTFCSFWRSCVTGKDCPRAFTPEVKAAAVAWGGNNAPISYFLEHPHCHDDNGMKEDENETAL